MCWARAGCGCGGSSRSRSEMSRRLVSPSTSPSLPFMSNAFLPSAEWIHLQDPPPPCIGRDEEYIAVLHFGPAPLPFMAWPPPPTQSNPPSRHLSECPDKERAFIEWEWAGGETHGVFLSHVGTPVQGCGRVLMLDVDRKKDKTLAW